MHHSNFFIFYFFFFLRVNQHHTFPNFFSHVFYHSINPPFLLFFFLLCLYQSRNRASWIIVVVEQNQLNPQGYQRLALFLHGQENMASRIKNFLIGTYMTAELMEVQEREACVELVLPSPSQTTRNHGSPRDPLKTTRSGFLSLMRFFWISGNQLSGTSFLIS